MTISTPKAGEIHIKTKSGNIVLGEESQVEDFILAGPGEYEIKGMEVFGVGKIYIIEAEEMRLAYLDKLNRPLTDEEAEEASEVDILFLPVGSEDVLDEKKALAIVNQLEPRIVIPVYYDSIDNFTKEEGVKPEFIDSLKVSRASLPETERKVYVLPWKQPLRK